MIDQESKDRTPIRFPGSKYRAAKYILPYIFASNCSEYREPFLGSGAIFFKIAGQKKSWLNDIDKELVNFFRVISNQSKREKLIRMVENVKPSKDLFNELKYSSPKSQIERAFRYFVINRTAYSGIMNLPNWGFHETKSVQPDKWPLRIEEAGLKLQGSKITNLDFEEVINAPSDGKVIIFVDPPYYKADQKRAYFHSFSENDHLRLARTLKKTKHRFCLTYDNCEEVKQLYSWAKIHQHSWRYHTANSNVTTRKMGNELIITNY